MCKVDPARWLSHTKLPIIDMTMGDPLHSEWMARASSGRNPTGTLTKEEKSSIDSSSLKPPLT